MSKNYHNLLSFWGNAKVKDQVTQWKNKITEANNSGVDIKTFQSLKNWLSNEIKSPLGTEDYLLSIDHEINNPAMDEIGFVSTIERPESLEIFLACLLHKLDKNVVIRNSYSTSDGIFGVSYTAPYNSTDAYSQSTSVKCNYDDFEFSEDAIADAEEQLEEAENEIIEYFVDDMPSTKSKFKKNIKKGRIDWDSL